MASAQDLFGQLWKEYALSDSRYMTSDTVVLCMETMTVVSQQCGFTPEFLGRAQLIDTCVASVGTALFPRSVFDRNSTFPTPPGSDHCVHESPVWRYALLCDQPVRPLCAWDLVLSAGAVLFLGVLLHDEFHLDCGAIL